jgi:hypothetical protein
MMKMYWWIDIVSKVAQHSAWVAKRALLQEFSLSYNPPSSSAITLSGDYVYQPTRDQYHRLIIYTADFEITQFVRRVLSEWVILICTGPDPNQF